MLGAASDRLSSFSSSQTGVFDTTMHGDTGSIDQVQFLVCREIECVCERESESRSTHLYLINSASAQMKVMRHAVIQHCASVIGSIDSPNLIVTNNSSAKIEIVSAQVKEKPQLLGFHRELVLQTPAH